MDFGKNTQTHFTFETALTSQTFDSREIDFHEIIDQKIWQLASQKHEKTVGKKLKDICKIHVGLTTLADKIFILKASNPKDESNTLFFESRLVGKIGE